MAHSSRSHPPIPPSRSSSASPPEAIRLDKWLWAARFYKTRAIAVEEIGKGRVTVNGQAVKASRDVRVGDMLRLRQGQIDREVRVAGISSVRGPAPVAQALYEETPDSIAARERAAEARRLAPEPADTIQQGRPTKQDRRRLAEWDERWSAKLV
ncbi:RNA-binding S4 domain-containing protein [Roseateles sp.]|uniref:RNA-binding S4 domain-containing protein n=1 Tax=Roseateles sp. TaxID=1971397 RepID=UPI0031D60778